MISVEEKIREISKILNTKELPFIERPYCRAVISFLYNQMDKIPDDVTITMYGKNTEAVEYCVLKNSDGTRLFGLPLQDESVLELPKVSFSLKELKER